MCPSPTCSERGFFLALYYMKDNASRSGFCMIFDKRLQI